MKLILFETNKLGTVSSLFIEVEEGESGREEEGDEGENGGISRVSSSTISSLGYVCISFTIEFSRYFLFQYNNCSIHRSSLSPSR